MDSDVLKFGIDIWKFQCEPLFLLEKTHPPGSFSKSSCGKIYLVKYFIRLWENFVYMFLLWCDIQSLSLFHL